ncbi:MAG: protein kinase [Planctomycetota bacterium]
MKTFVFTDIVRSVDLKSQMRGANDAERDEAFVSTILTPHRERIERGLADSRGRVVSTAGDGHFLVFSNTISAALWSIGVQRSHRDDPVSTPTGDPVEVRMSLHVGFPQPDPNDPDNFIGRVVDYAARLNDFASSGQVLVSTAALGLLKDAGLADVAFHHHGQRDLRGIGSVDVHELLYDGAKPRETRNRRADEDARRAAAREWTVLPATMGLTEYGQQGGSDPRRPDGGSSGGVATPPAPPVRTVGNYELQELLGSGGMGAVYKARHKQFGRDRAVKVIKPHLLPHGDGDHRHEEIIRRFYREIKAVGALDHPNIVVAIDSSSPEDETHYLVMEYVNGVGADHVVDRGGPMPVSAACEIARQAAVGLEYIHRQGMVHRDIKPSNLMLTLMNRSSLDASGNVSEVGVEDQAAVVKILDLGLALLVTDDQPRLTQLGHGAMGTAMYMSPEQWNTTSVDIRSDIYSLGCTLYHLLSGRPPFFDSDLRPQRAHEKAPIPTQYGRGDVPRELSRVLKKMMAKRPEERFERPADVAEALAKLADSAELTGLVERHRVLSRRAATRLAGDGSETIIGAGSATETLGPVPPTPIYGSWPSEPPRPLWRKLLTPAAVVAAVAAVLWMATIASQQQQSLAAKQESLDKARREKLIVPADLAASLLAGEIETRFDVLERLSRDPELQAAMLDVDTADRTTWDAVQKWIVKRKESERRVVAGSWFIVAADGTQIARAKPSKSIGKSYASRDYFHGLGRQLEEGESAEPISEPHLSAVYRSTTSKLLKVAFSTPIRREFSRRGEPKVLGVLGMSVDLGSFQVLEDVEKLPKQMEVVLVDLRRDTQGPDPDPGDPPRQGLLLHHPELAQYEVPTDPFRLPPELLSQVRTALKRRTRTLSAANPIIGGYQDLLERPSRGTYVGAFEPVVYKMDEEAIDTEWLVIVQEQEGR